MDTDALWGGQLLSLSFDPVKWVLRAEVQVNRVDVVSRYLLLLEEASELQLSRRIQLPWTYADLSEICVSAVGEMVRVEVVLWSDDDYGLRATCGGIKLSLLEDQSGA